MTKRLFNFQYKPKTPRKGTHLNIDLVQDIDTEIWYIRVNDQPYGTIKNIDSVQIFGESKSRKIEKDTYVGEEEK